ncbi:MAG TPA: type I-E CRISPR-associated protein Cse2/CasB [Acidobacteriaceae bacterium]|nr:type I-E CRISPR-associated protein Cse2/CasB [Acidobacteriaceae bacterium]
MRLSYLSEAHARWLRAWWKQLEGDEGAAEPGPSALARLGRGDRARLRRATSVEELETERAAQLLVAGLQGEEWRNSAAQRWFAGDANPVLMTAGVLAAVKEDARDGKSLAWRVGNAAANAGQAPMSELRFRRLLKARSLDEFFQAARRAVGLAMGTADVAVLADDLLAWAYEHGLRGAGRPAQSMCFRWAQDYYQPLERKNAYLAVDEEAKEGERA